MTSIIRCLLALLFLGIFGPLAAIQLYAQEPDAPAAATEAADVVVPEPAPVVEPAPAPAPEPAETAK